MALRNKICEQVFCNKVVTICGAICWNIFSYIKSFKYVQATYMHSAPVILSLLWSKINKFNGEWEIEINIFKQFS